MTSPSPSILLHSSHAPGATALAAIDAALTFAAFEQDIRVLFSGAAVLQLLKAQQNDPASGKNHAKLLASFSLYGIDTLYADADAMAGYGLNRDTLIANVQPVDGQQMAALLRASDAILSF